MVATNDKRTNSASNQRRMKIEIALEKVGISPTEEAIQGVNEVLKENPRIQISTAVKRWLKTSQQSSTQDTYKDSKQAAELGFGRLSEMADAMSDRLSDELADAIEASTIIKTAQKLGKGSGTRTNKAYASFMQALDNSLDDLTYLPPAIDIDADDELFLSGSSS